VYPSLSSTDSTWMNTDMHQSVRPASNLIDLHRRYVNRRTPTVATCSGSVPCTHTILCYKISPNPQGATCNLPTRPSGPTLHSTQLGPTNCEIPPTPRHTNTSPHFQHPRVIHHATILSTVDAQGKARSLPPLPEYHHQSESSCRKSACANLPAHFHGHQGSLTLLLWAREAAVSAH
jgi:hypothetical protein